MSGTDEEFDDFLARRKTLFRGGEHQMLEPPEDVDRLVLRRARDAIEGDRPQRMFRAPGWGAPLAIAATLLVALAFVFQGGTPSRQPQAELSVKQVAQRLDAPSAPAAAQTSGASTEAAAPASADTQGDVMVDLTQPAASPAGAAGRATAKASSTPAWRHDARSWLDEIERLRAQGRSAEADAELAEYKRQHRAYAGAPE